MHKNTACNTHFFTLWMTQLLGFYHLLSIFSCARIGWCVFCMIVFCDENAKSREKRVISILFLLNCICHQMFLFRSLHNIYLLCFLFLILFRSFCSKSMDVSLRQKVGSIQHWQRLLSATLSLFRTRKKKEKNTMTQEGMRGKKIETHIISLQKFFFFWFLFISVITFCGCFCLCCFGCNSMAHRLCGAFFASCIIVFAMCFAKGILFPVNTMRRWSDILCECGFALISEVKSKLI